jgi:chemotaxis protein methyltransferase CheR
LSYEDYLRFSQLVLDRCGLHFPPKRRSDLETGVRHAFAASTCANLETYYRLLRDPKNGAVEMDRLINTLTINETHFFRNAGLNDALYEHVLPQIIERQRRSRTLRMWSAGCASGEEPYSLAIMLRELLPDVGKWFITILGTDINTQALDRARKAVYGNWAFREKRAKQYQARYFRPQGKLYSLIPEVRRMVTFSHLNMVEDDYPSYETNTTLMDLIMCRNVTIYFTQAITSHIIERFYNALTDGGWLVVGHSEHSLTTYRRFQTHNFPGAILYQRTFDAQDPGERRPTTFLKSKVMAAPPDQDLLTPSLVTPAPAPVETPPTPAAQTSLSLAEREQLEPLSAQDVLERARELLNVGNSAEARDMLQEHIEDQATSGPDYAPACTLLGQAYANLGYWEQAENWCRRALRSDELALEAYYTLALVLQHQGQLDQAIDAMKKVVYIDRNNVLGHFGLANLYRNKNQRSRAQKSLANARRLLETRPGSELIPGSDGITVARLRVTITRQQRQWETETNDL